MQDEMLKNMFQEYKKKQMAELKQKQFEELEIAREQLHVDIPDEMTDAAIMAQPSMADKIVAANEKAAVVVPDAVIDSMKTDDFVAMTKNQQASAEKDAAASQATLKGKVAARQAELKDAQSKELIAAGVDPEKATAIVEERSAVEAEAAAELAKIDAVMAAEEQSLQDQLAAELRAALAATSDPGERSHLQVIEWLTAAFRAAVGG